MPGSHPYEDPRYLAYSQVKVDDVIKFGPSPQWAVVVAIEPGKGDRPTHWTLVWVFGRKKGMRESVTPSTRVVYAARTEKDAAFDRRNTLG